MFKVVEYWATCKCVSHPESIKGAVKKLGKSLINFIFCPYQDEASEVAFCIGRLIGSLINRPYVFILGDRLVLDRMEEQMRLYGCVKGYPKTHR